MMAVEQPERRRTMPRGYGLLYRRLPRVSWKGFLPCLLQHDTKILLQLRDQCEPRWRHRSGQRLDAEQVRRDVLHRFGGDSVAPNIFLISTLFETTRSGRRCDQSLCIPLANGDTHMNLPPDSVWYDAFCIGSISRQRVQSSSDA
jgi:hypothetical protein